MDAEMMNVVVQKMMLDLDRMSKDMNNEQVECVRAAMVKVLILRGALMKEELAA